MSDRWGIFDQSGNPALDVDTCVDIEYSNNSKVSDFPVEQGAFASYNKVRSPYEATVTVAVSGETRMIKALAAIEAMVNSTVLYHVVTPTNVYTNASVEKFSYKRSREDGAWMLSAKISLKQIREVQPKYTTVTLKAATVKKKDAATTAKDGKQQEKTPPNRFLNMTAAEAFKAGMAEAPR